jgi:peptide/nickel transport system substrate-binding protein
VKWSNGQAFTANDAAFTFNLLKKYPAADTNNLWHYLQSVTAPNASTLVLMLKQPYSPILWYAGGQTYMVPQSQWANVGDPTKYSNPKPVGTGPFMLDTFAPQLVTYKKNTNYWQPGKPQVNELRYPAYDSNQSVELDLDQGNLDWVGLFTPDVQKTYVSRDPAHNHYWAPLNSPTVLFMNLTKAPFNQQAVRQAINGALDREAMSTTAESGYDPPASPTGLVLPNQQSYLAPQYTNLKTTVDPAKSIALLQSAGFIRGANGIFQDKSGKPLSFSLDVVTGWTDWITMGQIIATNLKAIGINITVNTLAFSAYASALQTGNYQMGLGSVSAGPTPYFFYNALLNGQNAATPNDERWNDARTNQLLDQFATTTNPTEQKQAIQGLEQIMVQQVPVIMLVNASYLTEYSSTRFTGWPDQSNPYAVPDPWEQPDCETIVLNLKPVA